MSAVKQHIEAATKATDPVDIPVSKIAVVGYPLHEYADIQKVKRMQQDLRKGKLKPVGVTKLTPELRDKYGVDDPNKDYYLASGHHRFAAVRLARRKTIPAIPTNGRRA